MDELAQLAALCERLGAPPAQAAVLARQLWKRAEQLAAERGQTREEALARLLQLAVQGRRGVVPPEFRPPGPPPDQNSSAKPAK